MKISILLAASVLLLIACKEDMRERSDEIYSRHLKKHFKLSILSGPVPKDKSQMNLLLLNDGQDLPALRLKEVLDSMYGKGSLQPLIVVGIHAGDRMQEYGVSGTADFMDRGSKADKYSMFIENELLPLIKKKTGVRKFQSVAIAGWSLGGLSAFDIAWDHADKIGKVGVFSGSFWWRDKDSNDSSYSDDQNRILINKVRSSRKKPKLQFWFYAGSKEESSDRDKDGTVDVIDDSKDLIGIIQSKKLEGSADIAYTEDPEGKHEPRYWSKHFPAFLVWAFGKPD